MLSISGLFSSAFCFLSGSSGNANNLPNASEITFTDSHTLKRLNRERADFSADKELNYFLLTQKTLSRMPNAELHDFVGDEKNDPISRRLGAIELINRGDRSATLTFLYCLTINSDPVLTNICAIGLGELGNKLALPFLKNIEEWDPLYSRAQKLITEMSAEKTAIKVLAG